MEATIMGYIGLGFKGNMGVISGYWKGKWKLLFRV